MSKSKDWGALVFWIDNSKSSVFQAMLSDSKQLGKEKIRLLTDLQTFRLSVVR
jgi:hypothetical protein